MTTEMTIIIAIAGILLGSGGAVTVIMWFLNRKAAREDKAADKQDKAEENGAYVKRNGLLRL